MPRAPPRTSAVQAAHTFISVFIADSHTEDHIIPKNGASVSGHRPFVHFTGILNRVGADRVKCRAACRS